MGHLVPGEELHGILVEIGMAHVAPGLEQYRDEALRGVIRGFRVNATAFVLSRDLESGVIELFFPGVTDMSSEGGHLKSLFTSQGVQVRKMTEKNVKVDNTLLVEAARQALAYDVLDMLSDDAVVELYRVAQGLRR